MEELQKSSDSATQENGLLRAQVERLHVELREYRKRLSWMSSGGSGLSAVSGLAGANSRGANGLRNNDFSFDFPKFGDLPGAHLFNGPTDKNERSKPKGGVPNAPGVLSRGSLNGASFRSQAPAKSNSSTPTGNTNAPSLNGTPGSNASAKPLHPTVKPSSASTLYTSTSDSPSSSSDSHQSQLLSSSGTSPEPSSNSPPDAKAHGSAYPHTCSVHGFIDGEESFCARLGLACGSINNPIPAAQNLNGNSESVPSAQPAPPAPPAEDTVAFDWLAQQNGGQFDPVLFGDWREPQDAVLSQDFGAFFNDAFPLPDLGSPSHNLTEVATPQPHKKEVGPRTEAKLEDEEVVPGEDNSKMLTCTKIWYVLFFLNHSLPITKSYGTGIVFNPWRSSATAKSMSTIYARSCVPKLVALKVASS